MTPPLRRIAAAALAVPLALGMATSADAKSRFQAKSSGNFASAYWQSSESTGTGETVYTFGGLEARGDRFVDVGGFVDVITCPEDVVPWEDEDSPCTYDSSYLYAEAGAVTLDLDKRSAGATLTGTVIVDDGTGASTTAPISVTMVGTGPTYRAANSSSYRDSDGVRYAFRSVDSGRQGTVTGSIGDIEVAEGASGSFGTYRQMVREVLP